MKNTIMIAATGSGRGKTTFVSGLLYVLKENMQQLGYKNDTSLRAFKCGPDYIDPMFHKNVLSVPSSNLDSFFLDEEELRIVFDKYSGDINIIEAAMGLYDGIGTSSRASAYEIAKIIHSSIVLLVDGQGMGYSIIPLIKGFLLEDKEKLIKGIVINRISKKYYDKIAPVIEKETGIEVFGYIPKIKGAELESRHLGLLSPDENAFNEKIKLIAEQIQNSVNIGAIVGKGESKLLQIKKECLEKRLLGTKIAIARDEAFSFCYLENVDLLKDLGADIIFFSPIHDRQIPKNIDAIILYGGYPENYARELSDNVSMIKSIRSVADKVKILAECGGFMYLLDFININDENYNMVGLIHGSSYRTSSLVRFGYVNIENSNYCMRAHEFHHFDTTDVEYSDKYLIRNEGTSDLYRGMISTDNILAGFPHLYYLSCIDMIVDFLKTGHEGEQYE